MKIEIKNKIGQVTATKSVVKNYKKNPGNFTCAACAAWHYAKKNKSEMIIIPGNSYGYKIYHIAKKSDDLKKYTVISCTINVAIINLNGEVFQAIAK